MTTDTDAPDPGRIVEDLAQLGGSEGVLYRFPNDEVYRAITHAALMDPVRAAQLQIAMRPFQSEAETDEEVLALAEMQASALPRIVRLICPTIPDGMEHEVEAAFAMGLLADFLGGANGQVMPPAIAERLARIAEQGTTT